MIKEIIKSFITFIILYLVFNIILFLNLEYSLNKYILDLLIYIFISSLIQSCIIKFLLN